MESGTELANLSTFNAGKVRLITSKLPILTTLES